MPAHSTEWCRAPLLLCLFASHIAAISGQNGDLLSSKVNGTLPNGSSFQSSASQITQSNKQGLISSTPMVRRSSVDIQLLRSNQDAQQCLAHFNTFLPCCC